LDRIGEERRKTAESSPRVSGSDSIKIFYRIRGRREECRFQNFSFQQGKAAVTSNWWWEKRQKEKF
jgi:hypothetical protein